MTTSTVAPVLPLEVRRQLWNRLWRELLLRSRPRPQPSPLQQDDEGDTPEAA